MENNTSNNAWMSVVLLGLLAFVAWTLISGFADINRELAAIRGEIAHLEDEVHELRRLPTQEPTAESDHQEGLHAEPHAVVEEIEYDFGRIRPADGAVSTVFAIRNDGEGVLTLGTITTSCACTSAEASSMTIQPGGEATISVTFDPNVHEEPKDRFSRTVYIPTNDHDMPEIELTVFVDIIEDE